MDFCVVSHSSCCTYISIIYDCEYTWDNLSQFTEIISQDINIKDIILQDIKDIIILKDIKVLIIYQYINLLS